MGRRRSYRGNFLVCRLDENSCVDSESAGGSLSPSLNLKRQRAAAIQRETEAQSALKKIVR
jgi:hypothetical protein